MNSDGGKTEDRQPNDDAQGAARYNRIVFVASLIGLLLFAAGAPFLVRAPEPATDTSASLPSP